MALENSKPFGLKDLKITDENGSNAVDLPAGRFLRFAEVMSVATFDLNGITVAAHSKVGQITWEIEAGGISLYALAKLTGRTATLTGSSPNRVLTLNRDTASFPYVRIYGKSLGDEGDDVHCKILRAKLTSIEGTFRGSEFVMTTCRGIAVPDSSGIYMSIVVNETETAL